MLNAPHEPSAAIQAVQPCRASSPRLSRVGERHVAAPYICTIARREDLSAANFTSTTTTNHVSSHEERLHSRSGHTSRRRCRNNSIQRKAACTWLKHPEFPDQLQRKKRVHHHPIHTNPRIPVRDLPPNRHRPSPSLRHSNRRLRPPKLQHSPRKPNPTTSRRRRLPHSTDLHSRHIGQQSTLLPPDPRSEYKRIDRPTTSHIKISILTNLLLRSLRLLLWLCRG